jgi:hypothetical protein
MLFEMTRICPFSEFSISSLKGVFFCIRNLLPVIGIMLTGKVSLDESEVVWGIAPC